MPAANVRSIAAIREFRAAVQVFLDEAQGSLDLMRMELQRALEWIEHDRPHYWEGQMRRAFDLVAQTRTALETCLMRTVAGHRPSCIEEKQAHAAAKRRLEHCREQIDRVKKWTVRLHHEANEFRGRMAGLQRALEHDVPKLLALLQQTADILEQYAEIAPAVADDAAMPAPPGAHSSAATSPLPHPPPSVDAPPEGE
jgi:hypothetical protein